MDRNRLTRMFDLTRGALLFALVPCLLADGSARADGGGTINGEIAARPKNRAGVVVYLDKVPGAFRPPAHPVAMDQKGMKFVPHVLAVMKGTTVNFVNNDTVRHNVFSPDNEKYNLGTWAQGESKSYTYKTPGLYHQLCNIHPEMGAVIMVLENPFFAVSGDDGKFKIEGVPAGTYTLKTWAEKGHPSSQQVTVAAGAAVDVKVEAGK